MARWFLIPGEFPGFPPMQRRILKQLVEPFAPPKGARRQGMGLG